MGLVSVTQVSDGNTASAADVNGPINTIVTAINGNLDSNNLATNAVSTAKIQDAAITSAKLGLSKTVDTNGWTIYDYNGFKKYVKRLTFSAGVGTTATTVPLSSTLLPTGMSTLGTNFITGTKVIAANAYGLNWGFEMTTTSTAIGITGVSPSGTVTYTGWFDVEITTP